MAKRPTMPKADPTIAALFERLLPTDERIVIRPMFGHKAAFVKGNMFTGTFGTHVFVRLDEPSRAELLPVGDARPFEPMKGRPMTEYVQLPDSFLAERSSAEAWIARALQSTSAMPPKRGKTRDTRAPRSRQRGRRTQNKR